MRRIKLLTLLLALWLTPPQAVAQAVNVQDSLALVDFYDSTNGPDWTNNTGWKNGPVSTWYGVTIADDRVTSLELLSNQLSGFLPASFGNLTNLRRLILFNDGLSSLPANLGNLKSLDYLNLGGNQITDLPASLGNLANLLELSLGGNQFSDLPTSLSNLKS